MLRSVKLLLTAALGVVAVVAPAQAAYHYSTTIRFSGSFVSEEYDSGTVITRVSSRASWSLHDPTTVVTVQRGAYALFPSGHTKARLSVAQSGFQTVCTATQQAFTDSLARQPRLAWFALRRSRSGGVVTFGWSGEQVNRHRDAATEGSCSDAGGTEAGGGNVDEAGSAGMAGRFGLKILLSNRKLLQGRSIVRRVSVAKTHTDMFAGTGLVETFTGHYTVLLSRVS